MIDGISGSGGPVRGPIGPRSAPAPISDSERAHSPRRVDDGAAVVVGRSALVADLAASPPVNAGRVAELKAQIASGRYPVDPLRIADAMLTLDRGRP